MPKYLTRILSVSLAMICSADGQTFVYSGREYLRRGTSWPQIREADATTGRKIQLTNSPRNHFDPWCTPDGKAVLFTSSTALNKWPSLYRFDRTTRAEDVVLRGALQSYSILGALDESRVLVEDFGTIAVVDIAKKSVLRTMPGTNPVLSPDHRLIAVQREIKDALIPSPGRHVVISATDGSGEIDAGEGITPVFSADCRDLLFIRFNDGSRSVDVVRFRVASRQEEILTTKAPEGMYTPYGLTISPDSSTIVLSSCCGEHGSGLYWKLNEARSWVQIDGDLDKWAGWSRSGLLLYATSGHVLRPLDDNRQVWTGDIKVFDSHSGNVRSVIAGIGLNDGPSWCGGR